MMKQAMIGRERDGGRLLLDAAAQAEPFGGDAARRRPAFVATLSNNTPLAFGMDAEQTRARARHALHLCPRTARQRDLSSTFRNLGGSGLIPYRDRLFLQFRKGRLAGWKDD